MTREVSAFDVGSCGSLAGSHSTAKRVRQNKSTSQGHFYTTNFVWGNDTETATLSVIVTRQVSLHFHLKTFLETLPVYHRYFHIQRLKVKVAFKPQQTLFEGYNDIETAELFLILIRQFLLHFYLKTLLKNRRCEKEFEDCHNRRLNESVLFSRDCS